MEKVMGTIQIAVVCGFLLSCVFMILLAMPQSQLRAFLLPIIGWGMAIFCGLYAISPVDLIPEIALGPVGFIDDVGVIAAGITAAGVAMTSRGR